MTNWDEGQQPQPYQQPYGQPPQYGPPAPYGQAPYGQPPQYGPYPPGPAYNYQYPQPSSTNGLAIASLVLGILWIYWIGSILALIFGYVARNQIRERRQGGDGLAIAGIVLGWVGVATLAIVIVVLVAAAGNSS